MPLTVLLPARVRLCNIWITAVGKSGTVSHNARRLGGKSTVIVAPKAFAEFPGALVMANGDTKTVGDFKIEAPCTT